MNKQKMRLDSAVQIRYPELSRTLIQSLIMQGKVKIDGIVCTKAGTLMHTDAVLTVDHEEERFVSRAGYKLAYALEQFGISVEGLIAMDAGLSTGGFTDCLLQAGVAKVYGVDVGYGQVHEKIRRDPRVVVMERTNLRHLEALPEPLDVVTLDLSFISVLKVMPAVTSLLHETGRLIVLIKPQFEAQRHQIGRGGIIKDQAVHKAVIQRVIEGIEAHGFVSQGVVSSPILGGSGNKEFLATFIKSSCKQQDIAPQ